MPNAATVRRFFLWLEAVNFDATATDIDDLSAIRGASEAMVAVPRMIFDRLADTLEARHEIILSSASILLGRIEAPDAECIASEIENILTAFDAFAAKSELKSSLHAERLMMQIWPHLTFAWGMEESGGDPTQARSEIRRAQAAARRSQFERLTVDVPPPADAKGFGVDPRWPCQEDLKRPRGVKWYLPESADRTKERLYDVSWGIALRRCLGRRGRRIDFYERILGERLSLETPGFADDFAEIVEKPPAGVPPTLANKIGVLWLDANDIGKMWNALAKDEATIGEFGRNLAKLRANFLRGLLEFADDRTEMRLDKPTRRNADGQPRQTPVLRFETLLWGADEALFVFPAWAAAPLLEEIGRLLAPDKWQLEVGGEKREISHAAGLVLCSYKSPIRAVKALAVELAEAAKSQARESSLLQYWVMGHVDLPTRPLEAERKTMFGIDEQYQPAAFSLPLGTIGATLAEIARIRGGDGGDGVPRGKLAEALQQASERRLAKPVTETVATILERRYEDSRGRPISAEDILSPALAGGIAGAEHAPLIHLLELWPYAAAVDGVIAGQAP